MSNFNPDNFAPLVEPQKPTPSQTDLDRTLRKISNVISINSYIGIALSMIAVGITAGIVFISTTLTSDRKIFFSGILFVATIGLQIVICISRSDPTILLILTTLSTFISALTLGLSIQYA